MSDIKTIMSWLEGLAEPDWRLFHSDSEVQNIANETLAILKEQEPRVLDWDEIKNYSVVYGEFKGIKDIYPLIITFDIIGRPLSWNPCINTSEEFLFLVYDEEDRKNTRCWNKEPTEEQRQAVKWE